MTTIPSRARILVTGGAGAIGSTLARRLLAAGCEVTILDDLSSGRRELVPDDARFVEGSVESGDALETAFGTTPDFVLHLAALFANQNSVEHPQRDLQVNGMGTLNVLTRAHATGVRKVLYVSSSCVYGGKAVMDEADPHLEPETPYAITKLLGERYCDFFARHHGLEVIVVRPFNSYGPGELPGRYRNVVPNFFQRAIAGEPLIITGTGEETRDFTYVDDIVAGLTGALFGRTPPGAIFNLASGTDTRIVDLARMINECSGNRAGIQFAPRRAWDHVHTRRGVIERARTAFAYAPVVALHEGLQRTHDWLRQHLRA